MRIKLFLFLLSLSFYSNAATYNVRTDGSDTACNGTVNASSASSPNCAFRTVQKSANTAIAGDVVNIQSGTYGETVSLNASGGPSSRITFNGINSPIIRGNLYVNGNYVTVDGVTVSPLTAGVGTSAIKLNASNDIVQNCTVTNYGAGASDQATAITFEASGAFNKVDRCTIRDLNDIDVFHVFGHDHVISNNYVNNIVQINYNLNHTDFIQTWGWPGGSSYNILIENNLVTNVSAQLGATETNSQSTIHDWTFRNNIIVNVNAPLFSGIPNTIFYNNLIQNVGNELGYAISLYHTTGYSSLGDKFINNAFIGNGVDISFHDPVSGTVISNNYFANANYTAKNNGQTMGTSFVNGGNPNFVNAGLLDFHIQAGSVLIGAGSDLSALFISDKDGFTRTVPWDIGPYEFNGGSGSILPPSNLRIVSGPILPPSNLRIVPFTCP